MKLAPGTPLDIGWLPDEGQRATPIARIAMAGGRAQLEWSAEALAFGHHFSALRYPPEPGLIAARTADFEGLHGFLADALPDAWGMLVLRRRVRKLGHDFDRLDAVDWLALVGDRGRGALTFRPASLPDPGEDTIDLDLLAAESAHLIKGEDSPLVDWLAHLAAGSGGARPKAHITFYDDGSIGAGDTGIRAASSEWIVKFASPKDPPDIGAIEMAYADMARLAGIDMAEARLLPAKGAPGYFATRRFDRPAPGKRLHMVSLAGAVEASPHMPSIDYDGLLRAVLAITRDMRDVEKAFRRMVFNVLAINRDDHARQHAFLMAEDGTWQLGPAYDLTFSNGPGGEHYMAVEGEGATITCAHVMALGRKHAIAERQIARIIDEVRSALTHWPMLAQTYGASLSGKEIAEALARKDREFARGVNKYTL